MLDEEVGINIVEERPPSRPSLVNGYRVEVYLEKSVVTGDKNFIFSIDSAGRLNRLQFPTLQVKIGEGMVTLSGNGEEYGFVRPSDQKRVVMANALVNWLESVIKEKNIQNPQFPFLFSANLPISSIALAFRSKRNF